jgi:Ca2+-binding EF-hand superfamily protein
MIKKQFISMDVNGDGFLSPEELQRGLNSAGHSFDIETISEIAEMLDTNMNGTIDYNEFIAACMQSG